MKHTCTLVLLLAATLFQTLNAGTVALRFFNPQITGTQYCVTVQIMSQDVNFEIGTSTILFTYDQNAITNASVTPINFSTAPCNDPSNPSNGTSNLYTTSFTSLEQPGLAECNYAILLNAPNTGCPTITTTKWLDVAEFCFDVVNASIPSNLTFDLNSTDFNTNADDGMNMHTLGTLTNGTGTTTLLHACNDGIINGDEVLLDCGGFHCCSCVTAMASPTTVCSGGMTTLTATGGTTYQWDNGAGTGASVTVSPTTTTTYNVTITDASCCTLTDQVTVTVNAPPTAVASASNTSICPGDMTTLMASGGTSYQWDNGAGTGASVNVTPAATTTYTVTVTDANNCTATDQVTVTVNPLPTAVASASNTSICPGDATTLMASGGASYQWDNGAGTGASVNVSPAATTTYTVTVTDSNNCMATDQVTVTVNALPTASASASNTTICLGDMTTLMASGGTSYQWDNGAGTGASVNVTPAVTTTYTVTVTDANNCMATDQVTIIVNIAPTTSASATNSAICAGDMTTLNASGGTTYQWDNGAGTGASVNVTPATTTTYTVTVTDANNCTATDQVTVTVNPLPTANAGPDAFLCAGASTTLTASGGTSYQWDNGGGTNASITVSPAVTTTYTVTVTDANNCVATDQVTVNIITCVNTTVVSLKVFLEGPFSGGSMVTTLNSNLPDDQPFSGMPWNYNDMGAETNVAVPTNAVDWVLIEIRDAGAVNTVVERHAAFVLNNGDVVDVDGVTVGVNFTALANSTSYYVVIRSRNHLDVLSANMITVLSSAANYDFTTAVTQAHGKDQMKDIGGTAVLYAFDIDGNGVITVDDFNEWNNQLNTPPTVNIFATGDANLDSNLTVADFGFYQLNAAVIGVPEIRY